jgi:hypothetical protein
MRTRGVLAQMILSWTVIIPSGDGCVPAIAHRCCGGPGLPMMISPSEGRDGADEFKDRKDGQAGIVDSQGQKRPLSFLVEVQISRKSPRPLPVRVGLFNQKDASTEDKARTNGQVEWAREAARPQACSWSTYAAATSHHVAQEKESRKKALKPQPAVVNALRGGSSSALQRYVYIYIHNYIDYMYLITFKYTYPYIHTYIHTYASA